MIYVPFLLFIAYSVFLQNTQTNAAPRPGRTPAHRRLDLTTNPKPRIIRDDEVGTGT
jgi:hypothetical protein